MTKPDRDHPADLAASEVVGAVVPGIGWIAGPLLRAAREESQRNASTALRAAERASGMSREDLEERIAAEPAMLPLYLHVLWAAGMNGHDETLRAMGTALGDAARAHARNERDAFDTAEDVLRAMREFTPRHWAVLVHVAENSPDQGSPPEDERWQAVTARNIALGLELTEATATAALAALAAAGLTRTAVPTLVGTSPLAYPITSLGLAVLHAARAHADEEDLSG